MSVRLYLKLPKAELDKEILLKMFSDFQTPFTAKLIKERRKKECRGFGFVTVPTEEAAEEFISRYNQKPLIYNGEVYKDENGNDFLLVIERALPRKKKTKPQQASESQGETQGESSPASNNTEQTSTTETPTGAEVQKNTERTTAVEEGEKEKKAVDKPQRRKKKKSRRKSPAKIKAQKPTSVSESVQPDPRWANELAKLKEMLAAQTSN
ncbi:MAG: RNA-binding protein [Geminocystis sp.]|nr:RNA-binding protein [Geminocystis sp.]HIK37709.1 RNA-binding protein [Geminocystis sp. M7585_C2015_104]MCS7147249.1 RNA-binding protein [Geminocystis sp.]MCX8078525.1 RNA-binding protein [Geminocystis sp.]MDW8116246.1 RNA-binding protein [Geminocystis sp.]